MSMNSNSNSDFKPKKKTIEILYSPDPVILLLGGMNKMKRTENWDIPFMFFEGGP